MQTLQLYLDFHPTMSSLPVDQGAFCPSICWTEEVPIKRDYQSPSVHIQIQVGLPKWQKLRPSRLNWKALLTQGSSMLPKRTAAQ